MTIQECLQVLLKRAVRISIIVFLVAALFAAYYYLLAPNKYTASSTLFIINEKDDAVNYNDVLMAEKLVADYKEIIVSRRVLDAASAAINGVEIDEDDIDVSSVNGTRMISIDVTDSNPNRAMVTANAIADTFCATVKDIVGLETVSIIDRAEIPEEPSGPKRIRNISLAGIAALLLSSGVYLLVAFADTTMHSREDIENTLGLPVLARIPALKKKQILVLESNGRRD